ncbi:Ig-like domain-containing protein [Gemmatimonas sp.]|uniref:Ig-like domain-containing protein n=1 Tax=Gemmatimonas sp. TaxID=1962908 RepID=UPI0039832A11
MTTIVRRLTRWGAFAGVTLLGACGDSTAGGPPPPAAVVSRVDLSAATTALTPLQTVQFSAVARTSGGDVVSNAQPVWTSTAPSIASVNASGIVTGVAVGSATIRATVGAVSGTLDVTVASGAGVLATIVVSAQDRTIPLGQLTQASISGRDAVGGTVALGTRVVTWSTGNSSIATVTSAGVVTGVGVGTVSLQASVADGAVPKTGSVQLTVNSIPNAPISADVVMPGLTFSPVETVVKQGGTVRFIFPALAHNVIWDPRLAGSPTDINTTSNVTVSRTFPSVGVFPFKCTLHPGMDGTVIVSP